ncbi:MAG: NADH-quinone oxidoreductase subunit M [Anaerolineae bacterium]|jgi:NADH-quinone oxidoreductase subunit M|nr:NADH-quinone oxidoreductase subunit M [Anaerolineae bacterium]
MGLNEILLLATLGAPLLAALALAVFPKPLRRAAGWIAGASAALSLLSVLALLPALRGGQTPALNWRWIPDAGIAFSLQADWLTLPFLVTEAVVTLAAILYSWGYHKTDERTPYFYALLLVFAVGMSGTTVADNMFLFYIFWELMLVASCVLILVWGEGERRSGIALKYFIFTHVGSLMVLVGLLLLYGATGSDSFAVLRAGQWALAPGMVSTVTALFIIGFCVKMAIFPVHLWLPDAHTVAPMPVTIMLAAAMLSMGAYGILRFPMSLFSAEQLLPFAVPMMVAGIISEIYGALMALAEQDVKRIVAYSSVSQMGYILFGLGTLTHDGVVGATLHVIYHAIVKALLFMIMGLVIRATGRRRIGELGGLGRALPGIAICAAIGALGIAGMPPLGIFTSEWMIFSGGFHTTHIGLSVATLFGSLLTVVYALLLVGRIFLGEQPEGLKVSTLPRAMVLSTVVMTALLIVEGLLPAPLFDWAEHELLLLLGGAFL